MRGFTRVIGVRKLGILAVAGVGLGLFGTGVHGLTQIDGRLATATESQTVRSVDVRHDCPRDERPELQRL